MHDEGYIKFKAHWTQAAPLLATQIDEINYWRQQLYAQQLIGAYPDGIGFGNLSQRYRRNQFIISGSATGNFPVLGADHYSVVEGFDIQRNEVFCRGPIIASSESMSHAVIFQTCSEVNAVVHVHHLGLWEKYLDQLPTTSSKAAYGSPEMAQEIIRLLEESDVRTKEKVFVMAGHREGIIAFGENLEAVVQLLVSL